MNVGSTFDLEAILTETYNNTLAAFYQNAVQSKWPIALWRHPHSESREAVIDLSGSAQLAKIDFTQKTPGFAFSPFVNEDGHSTRFIRADIHITKTGVTSPTGVDTTPFLNALRRNAPTSRRWVTPAQQTNGSISTQAEFCTLVDDAIDYIRATGIQKIVVSRATEVPLPPQFDPVTIFGALCQRYPHAFVSLVSIPAVGTWIGASPELLLSLSDRQLHTIALAGTQLRPADISLTDVTWGEKEIVEQALVSDYVREFFQQIGVRHFTEDGPRTVSAGSIVHLRTDFNVQRPPAELLALANHILDTLHPTSAVCGMPKKEALSFILEKEKYNRTFYSGFLGPVHLNKESHLFVNLRCMQLLKDTARLYIGAGITQDSVPQSEWEETILKSNTLLSVLQKSEQ